MSVCKKRGFAVRANGYNIYYGRHAAQSGVYEWPDKADKHQLLCAGAEAVYRAVKPAGKYTKHYFHPRREGIQIFSDFIHGCCLLIAVCRIRGGVTLLRILIYISKQHVMIFLCITFFIIL